MTFGLWEWERKLDQIFRNWNGNGKFYYRLSGIKNSRETAENSQFQPPIPNFPEWEAGIPKNGRERELPPIHGCAVRMLHIVAKLKI